MIKLRTKINTLGRARAVSIANMSLRWCRSNMGVNQRKKFQPIWTIKKGYGDGNCGEYDAEDNEVFIYWDNITDVKELIGTCIHEWQHQLQPILTKYDKHPGTYDNNPYEIEARKVEKNLTPVCWLHIDKRINKTNYDKSNRSIRARRSSIDEKVKRPKGWQAKMGMCG